MPLRGHLPPVAGLLAVAGFVYGPALLSSQVVFSPHSDLLPQHLAMKQVLWDALQQGRLPLWRSDQMMGAPAMSDPQSLYLHPLQALFWLVEPLRAYGPTLFLELVVSALGGYALAGALGCPRAVAFLAGVAQLVCFKWIAVTYAGWSSVLPQLCLLPAVLAALLLLSAAPGLGRALALSFCLALALCGGAPQTLYYLLLMTLPWLVLVAPGRTRFLVWAAGAAALAFACAAHLWLPLLSELSLVARGGQDYAYFLSGHGLGPRHLLTLVWPQALGSPLDGSYPGGELWEDVAYFGLLPLLGALVQITRYRHLPGLQRGLVVIFVASVLLSLQSPVLRLLYDVVPGYSRFRFPGRMLFVSAVLGIALFGLFLHWLSQRLRASQARVLLFAVCAVMIAEGRVHASRYLTTVEPETLQTTASHPVHDLDGSATRIAVAGRSAFNYGEAQSLGVSVVNGYNPFSLSHYKRYMDLSAHGMWRGAPLSNWFDLPRIVRPDLLREASVEHIFSREQLDIAGVVQLQHRPKVRSFLFYTGFRDRPVSHYALQGARPFARFATQVVTVPTLEAMADRMQRERLDGQAYVLSSEAASLPPLPSEAVAVVVDKRVPGQIELRTERSVPGLLVVAESWHPGWSAQVDGQPAQPVQTNLNLIGVGLPPGEHQVRLRFSPLHFREACTISIAGWLLLIALGAVRLAKRVRQ